MKTITTFALLGLLTLSGATLIGCSGSLDVQPNPNSTPDTSSDTKKTTTYDANGNVIQQKTTETKTTP